MTCSVCDIMVTGVIFRNGMVGALYLQLHIEGPI